MSQHTIPVQLNLDQIEYLRSVIYEYYQSNTYQCSVEQSLHQQLEVILANASNTAYLQTR